MTDSRTDNSTTLLAFVMLSGALDDMAMEQPEQFATLAQEFSTLSLSSQNESTLFSFGKQWAAACGDDYQELDQSRFILAFYGADEKNLPALKAEEKAAAEGIRKCFFAAADFSLPEDASSPRDSFNAPARAEKLATQIKAAPRAPL